MGINFLKNKKFWENFMYGGNIRTQASPSICHESNLLLTAAKGLPTFVTNQSEGRKETLPRQPQDLTNREGVDWSEPQQPGRSQPIRARITSGYERDTRAQPKQL